VPTTVPKAMLAAIRRKFVSRPPRLPSSEPVRRAQQEVFALLYERPPVNKSPGVNKPRPPGAPGAPEEGGERYQHIEEIAGALRAQFCRPELMRIVFLMMFEVFASGASKSG
jgi:hypothetical protein